MESGPTGVLPITLLNRITHSRSLWHEPFIGIYNCLGSIPPQRLNYGFGLTKQRPLSSVFTSPRKLDGPRRQAMNFKTAKENVFILLSNYNAAFTLVRVVLVVISNDIMVLLLRNRSLECVSWTQCRWKVTLKKNSGVVKKNKKKHPSLVWAFVFVGISASPVV